MSLFKFAVVCVAVVAMCGCDQGQPTPPVPTPPAPTPDKQAKSAIADPYFVARKKKAESGNATEQYNVGIRYFYGSKTVGRDYAKALKWFRLSADQGFFLSQSSLGLMYRDGKGVPKDYAEAYVWYAVAAINGGPISAPALVKDRDLAASKLTPDQLTQAQKRATELIEKIGSGK